VEAFLWAALGFLVLAVLAGGAYVGVRAWRAWQAFTSVAAGVGGGLDRLLAVVDRLTQHGERTAERVQELSAAVERLERSQARARILVGAAGEVVGLLRAARALVPEK
jgi:hypothetical protein